MQYWVFKKIAQKPYCFYAAGKLAVRVRSVWKQIPTRTFPDVKQKSGGTLKTDHLFLHKFILE